MNRLTILIALLLALGAGTAQAQTAITATTLSAAISSAQAAPASFTITVSSATGMAANGVLWIEGSVYRILAVSGTTITVINQAFPASHLTSAVVYVVPVGAQVGPTPATGSCLRSTAGLYPAFSPFTLMFNMTTGAIGSCRGASGSRTWFWTTFNQWNPSANPPVTP